MEVIPAIDLMNGLVVRLSKGDLQTATIYSHFGNSLQVAKNWEKEGAKTIHIVDLDAAMNKGSNKEVILDILNEIRVPIQLGGGLRTKKNVQEILNLGIHKAIIGTMAFEKTFDLVNIIQEFGNDRLMVALDYVNHNIMIRGWKINTQLKIEEAIIQFLNLGVTNFLLTAISQNGLLKGPDFALLKKVIKETEALICAAGGISNLNDLVVLKKIGVQKVVVGKALYEKKFTLKEAIRITRD